MKKMLFVIGLFFFSALLMSCTDTKEFYLLSPGDQEDGVRMNIYLTLEHQNEPVLWTSSHEDVISTAGVVTRPEVDEQPIEVVLTSEHKGNMKSYAFTVLPKTGDYIYDLYPSLNDENHIIQEITYEELIELLTNKEEALIYLGFETCPWCKEYLPIFHQMAKNRGFETLYMYDFRSIRTIESGVLNADFQALIDLIDEEYLVKNPNDDALWWLYAPTFIGLNNNDIQGLFTGALPNHSASLSYLTGKQEDELKSIFSDIISNVRSTDPNCEC